MYEKFLKLLELHNVKPADVARATGIYTSTFADWKSGRSKPKLPKLQKLSKYFNVPLEYFVEE